MMGTPYGGETEREAEASEKTGIERFFEYTLEKIHSDMRILSREKHQISELELNSREEAIEEDVDYVQRVLYSLTMKRGDMTPKDFKGKVKGVPKLGADFAFDEWWGYILSHVQIIYESLDAMGMLLTDSSYKDVWGETMFDSARLDAILLASGEKRKNSDGREVS